MGFNTGKNFDKIPDNSSQCLIAFVQNKQRFFKYDLLSTLPLGTGYWYWTFTKLSTVDK